MAKIYNNPENKPKDPPSKELKAQIIGSNETHDVKFAGKTYSVLTINGKPKLFKNAELSIFDPNEIPF